MRLSSLWRHDTACKRMINCGYQDHFKVSKRLTVIALFIAVALKPKAKTNMGVALFKAVNHAFLVLDIHPESSWNLWPGKTTQAAGQSGLRQRPVDDYQKFGFPAVAKLKGCAIKIIDLQEDFSRMA
jgi:hypothetical protein